MDIREYEELVSKNFSEGSEMTFPNGLAEHARVIITHLFAHAENSVKIISEQLVDSVDIESDDCDSVRKVKVYSHGRVIEEAKSFLLRPESTLEILLEDSETIKGSDFLRELNEFSSKIIIKAVPGGSKKNLIHMMVSDECAYRLEFDHNRTKAVACAKDPTVARQLTDFFDKLSIKSKNLPHPASALQ